MEGCCCDIEIVKAAKIIMDMQEAVRSFDQKETSMQNGTKIESGSIFSKPLNKPYVKYAHLLLSNSL